MNEEELLEKLLEIIDKADNKEWAKNENCNFLSVSLDFKKIHLDKDYNSAKIRVDKGGYVLVIDKKKVYSYKQKNEDEYMRYLKNQIRNENLNKMNYYGI